MIHRLLPVAACLLTCATTTFTADTADWSAISAPGDAAAVSGQDNWWFLTDELASLAAAAADPQLDRANGPLAAITHYHDLLSANDIQLVLVPVPTKAAIHPDRLPDPQPDLQGAPTPLQDTSARLREAGITVVDPTQLMRDLRAAGHEPHCRQDSHWSPAGLAATAEAVAKVVTGAPFAEAGFATATAEVSSVGDLPALANAAAEPETFTITRVLQDGAPLAPDETSPVVLIGDSHCLVFHQPISGGIDASGAGFPDHLARHLGVAVDLVANQGSGVNAPWARLARRRGDQANLAGKQVVIWCLAARDLLNPSETWKSIPVIR